MKTTLIVPADICIDALHSEVHLGKTPGRVVDLLTINGNVIAPPTMLLNELFRLHEHSARTAAWVIDASFIGLQHLDQRSHHGTRRKELTAALAFGTRKAGEEIFVDPAQKILGPVGGVMQADVGEEVDQLAEHSLIQRGPGVVLRQNALQTLV